MHISRSGHKIDFVVDQEKVSKIKIIKDEMGEKFPRFGILILSYNASGFIEKTLDRIPKELFEVIDEIFIFDDCSPDGTFEIAKEISKDNFWKGKLNIYKNPTNLRYGGNQKAGYRYAISKGIDYTIMLHGDGQYAPEYIPDLILPALEDKKEVVFASRMIHRRDALRGGMPLYKFIGNQILTKFENIILGTSLYEFHSGYRMYASNILKKIPFEKNTNEFHFDTQIIIQCRALGITIHEVPIKTFYGDEECNVDGFRYAKDVCLTVLEYRLHQLHLLRRGQYYVRRDFVYTRKRSPFSSHEKLLLNLSGNNKNVQKVLEFGGSNGILYGDMSGKGYKTYCADKYYPEHSIVPKSDFLDLNKLPLKEIGYKREFDYLVISDLLPRVEDHVGFLNIIKRYVLEDGKVLLSVPNIAIWFYRLSLLLGRFNYGDKGVLDRKHLHFYTKDTLVDLLEENGYEIENIDYTGLPTEVVFESIGKSRLIKVFDKLYFMLVTIWPSMFAYQFVVKAHITRLNPEEGEGKIN